MKHSMLFMLFCLVIMAGANSAIAQSPNDQLSCQLEDINRAIATANSLLLQAQSETDAGAKAASLRRLAQVQSTLTDLFSSCFSGTALSVEPSPPLCLAGLILCDLMPQAIGAQTFAFTSRQELGLSYNEQDTSCAHSGQYGLRVAYNFTDEDFAGWGIHWDNAQGGKLDASRFRALTFWVKGDAGGELFEIGLKARGQENKVQSAQYVIVPANEWVRVAIPLSAFAMDTASVNNINLGFNANHGAGNICVDDFALVP